MQPLNKIFVLFFTKDFATAAFRMISALRNYRIRFVIVAVMSIFVVILDMLSALSVGVLLLAIDGDVSVFVPSFGEVPNPLQGVPDYLATIYCISVILGMQLFREAILLGSDLFLRKLGIDVGADFRQRIAKVALSSSFDQVVKMKRNDLIVYGTNFATGVGTFAMEFSRLFSIIIIICLYSLFFLITEPEAFLLVTGVVLVLIIMTNKLLIELEKLSYKTRDVDLSYYGALQDSISGLRDITLLNCQTIFLKKMERLILRLKGLQWKSTVNRSIITPIQRSISLLFLGLGLIFLLALTGEGEPILSTERLVFIIFILLRLYGPVAQMNTTRSGLLSLAGSVSTITSFLEKYGVEIEQAKLKTRVKPFDISRSNNASEFGAIVIDSVYYNYEEDGKPALFDVSFVIPKHATTAIVGSSGAGKSTIVDLLTKLRSPTSGVIRVGDNPLAEIDITYWRDKIATIHQQGHIFHGTIAENISLFRDNFSIEEIEEAIFRANFGTFVQSLPMGLDTILGGPDIPLSGGQRQRLQIARAFLMKPQLLILDEATSAQDALSEEVLLRSIKRDFPSSSILVIAHRFSAIREADHIIVMDEGRVVDKGDWQDLLKRPGLFRDLFDAQSLHKKNI